MWGGLVWNGKIVRKYQTTLTKHHLWQNSLTGDREWQTLKTLCQVVTLINYCYSIIMDVIWYATSMIHKTRNVVFHGFPFCRGKDEYNRSFAKKQQTQSKKQQNKQKTKENKTNQTKDNIYITPSTNSKSTVPKCMLWKKAKQIHN